MYYNSTATEFQDKNDAMVTISDGDKILWAGLDTITADIDLSTIDDLEHIMLQGVTVDLNGQDLLLGENQRGELKYSGNVSIMSGTIQLIDVDLSYEEFRTENLKIDVATTSTISVSADSISFFNKSTIPTKIFNVAETFNMATDLMTGTTEKNDAVYWAWLDSYKNRRLVPDLEGTADGTTPGFLDDSTNTLFGDLATAGDIIYNTTTGQQTRITTTPTANGQDIAVDDDIFTSGDSYIVRILSPEGLGSVRARLGYGVNNPSGNLDDSYYTHAQKKKDIPLQMGILL